MGVYIPNISKPKECIECELFYIEFYMGEEKVGSACTLNDDDGSTIEADYNSCPLIEIPTPHGRLIDWDAFNSKLEIQYAEGRGKTLAPTILEEEP